MSARQAFEAAAPDQAGARKAALVLHALNAGDRHWLLRTLPAPQRALVQPLMDELAELGLPADRALVDEVLGGIPSMPAPAPAPRSALERASAADLAALLRGEPEALVGQLLSLRSWPWRDEFIALLPSAAGAAVLRALAARQRDAASGITTPALDQALCDELESRLGQLPDAGFPSRRLLAHWTAATAWLAGARRRRFGADSR